MSQEYPHAEQVLAQVVSHAQAVLGTRMVAAYALGSLAHGGFSPAVSDIDVAVILDDPYQPEDIPVMTQIHTHMLEQSDPLCQRVSLFWSTLSGLSQGADQVPGRFPPLDRLCLLIHGRLLAGHDVRSQFCCPDRDELTVAGARFAVGALVDRTRIAAKDPANLITTIGLRPTTKLILFPARFLFTADTGREGTNDAAVEHYLAHHQGPAADLVRAGFSWRYTSPDEHASDLLAQGFCALYRDYIDDYRARLLQLHEHGLADQFAQWAQQFS